MRTYSYGAKAPETNADLVQAQLKAAHRYKNHLIELERWRAAFHAQVLAPLRAARDAAHPDPKERPKLVLSAETKAELKAIDAQTAALAKLAYNASDAYWGTKLCVSDAVLRAADSSRKQSAEALVRYQRFEGGLLAVQLQKGLTVAELMKGDDSRVQIRGEGKRRGLALRVGSGDGRAPVWAVFPFFFHRELPAAGVVKWVKVTARKVATKTEYAVQLSVDNDGATLPTPALDTVAVDVGWRRFKASRRGLRVAAWVDSMGERGEVRVPERLLQRWQKTEDLGSIRDKHFNAALQVLLQERAAGGARWPQWLLEATRYAHAWNKPARLAALTWRWYHARPTEPELAGSDTTLRALEAWRKQDKHLYEWEAHQRGGVLRARRELYRVFAKQLARYRRIVVEHLDLRDFAELPEKDEPKDTPQQQAARPNRFKASVSELLSCMADACLRSGSDWVELEPAWTTQTCGECGEREEFDAAASVTHVCGHCGAEWDQDFNAAKNLLRAATSYDAAEQPRSRLKKAANAGESAVAQRRREGKQRKKAAALEKLDVTP